MRRLVSLAIVCALLGLALPLRAETARPLQVVASFSILADMLREVAGDAAQVHSLVGANADAHVFEPTPADAQRLARADLVVVNGLHFEGWIDRLVRSSGYRGPVIEATRGIEPRRVGRAVDPHAWQSLAHAQRYVENMRAALVAAAPSQAAAINARAAAYGERIAALDASARAAFEAVPRDQRRVVTTHDAFGYLGDAYGITFISPRAWNTDSEASAAGVASVIRQVRLHQARALFVENITDRRSIERISQETGARVGGTLYSDALSPPAAGADTYLRLYAHNVKSIAVALQAVAAR
ncbi:zinc ABC transporter substrate-binding protein [Piscinibacter sp.]|uniref:metal ABC transporter solute-binding protein, Zn/Mn family n=1 Tax=Piscinibacter sp. TaxID=1903157 RepID=UPI001B65983B|nr:zinc ABC transporter substrate-binding protein [Piscinibacter sp.]MBK7529423.1 zinc ABC transporter substrate-binding protein [Piscinibacter sp.]MBP6544609.1 zinc ABC transporter substrate-binding protein [Piscinibacter sp.]